MMERKWMQVLMMMIVVMSGMMGRQVEVWGADRHAYAHAENEEIAKLYFAGDRDGEVKDELVRRIEGGGLVEGEGRWFGKNILKMMEERWKDLRLGDFEVMVALLKSGYLSEEMKGEFIELIYDWEISWPGVVATDYLRNAKYEIVMGERGRMISRLLPWYFGGDCVVYEIVGMKVGGVKVALDKGYYVNRMQGAMMPGDAKRFSHYVKAIQKIEDVLRKVEQKVGRGVEVEVEMTVRVTVFPNNKDVNFVHDIILKGATFRFEEEPGEARLVVNEERRGEIRKAIWPGSCMTKCVWGHGGYSDRVAGCTIKGVEEYWGETMNEGVWQGRYKRTDARGVVYLDMLTVLDVNEWASEKEMSSRDVTMMKVRDVSEGVGGCYQMIVCVGGKEFAQDIYCVVRGGKERFEGWSKGVFLPSHLKGEVGTVILRPAREYAFGHERMDEILDGDLVYENVMLMRVGYDDFEDEMEEFKGWGGYDAEASGEVSRKMEEKRIGYLELDDRAKKLLIRQGRFKSKRELEKYCEEKGGDVWRK